MAKKSPKDIKAEAAKFSDLIAKMRKKEHNFALTLGKDGGVVLEADPKKSASVMWRQAKGNGGTSKGCMGVASVKGKVIQFFPEGGEEPPKALYLNTKKHLKDLGLSFKIAFVLPDGAVVGGDEEEEEDEKKEKAKSEAADPAAPAPASQTKEWPKDPPQQDKPSASEAANPAGEPNTGEAPAAARATPTPDPAPAVKPPRPNPNYVAKPTAEAAPVDAEEKRKELEAAFEPTALKLDRLRNEGTDKVAQKAEQMAAMFWSVLDSGDWKKAAGVSGAAKAFADKEIALLAAFPAPGADPADVELSDAQLLALDVSKPEDAARLMKEDLTVREPSDVFDPDHMIALSQKEFPYAGDASLRELMAKIEAGLKPDERETVITQLAAIVKADKGKLDADYDRYRVLLEQQKAFGTKNAVEDVPGLKDERFPDFRGSQEQLLFGAVLGEVFGIHEVFASLLSSTGGLVGPGNEAISMPDRNPIGLHGIFHDAAGYLKNYHDDGPGYNYLESDDEFLDTGNPLCGQVSGVDFWTKMRQEEDEEAAAAFAKGVAERADAQVLLLEKQLEGAREQTAAAIDDCLADYEALKKQAGEWTGWLPPGATDPLETMSDAAVYGAAGAAELAVDASTRAAEAGAHIAAAGEKVDAELDEYGEQLEGTVKKVGLAAMTATSRTIGVMKDGVEGSMEALGDGIGDAADGVTEAAGDIGNIAANAGDELAQTAARTAERYDEASGVLETAGVIASATGEVAGTVAKAAVGMGAETAEAVVDVGAAVLDTGVDLLKETGGVVAGLAETAATTAGKMVDIGADAAGDAFDAVVDIGSAVGGAMGGVADAAGGLMDDIVDNPVTEAVADKLSGWAESFGW